MLRLRVEEIAAKMVDRITSGRSWMCVVGGSAIDDRGCGGDAEAVFLIRCDLSLVGV